jgi:hypothetical protein
MRTDVDYIISLMKEFTPNSSKDEIGEDAAPAAAPSTGGASSGGGGGYPSVTKWTSGRKFGPTYNPDQKVWSTGLTRGKANTLL